MGARDGVAADCFDGDRRFRADAMSQYDDLARPFDRQLVQNTQKGGRSFTYIPASEVIVRLNKVLGPANWSSEAEAHRDGDWVIARVTLTAKFQDGICHATQYGGQEIKKYAKGDRAGQIMDLSSDFKGAVSDALKKCAQQLGVGLYLSRPEGAASIEPQSSGRNSSSAGQPGEGGGESTASERRPSGAAPPPKPTLGNLKADMEAAKKAGLTFDEA